MNKTEIKLQYNICEKSADAVPAIIVAAGASSRMHGINKQFMPILGVPVIARTLMTFESCAYISKIIIVTAKDSIIDMQLLCENYSFAKVTDIVEGGFNRHHSVINGIKCLEKNEQKVLIHDGARPFVTVDVINEVVIALKNFDSALCANKINDTVKRVDADGIVQTTVDRSMLYAAQTPQGIDVRKYLEACSYLPDVESFTDDASIMEAAGYKVKVIESSGKNIKITTPADIAIAEALVRGESEI